MSGTNPEWMMYLPAGKREEVQSFLDHQQAQIIAAENAAARALVLQEAALACKDEAIAIADFDNQTNVELIWG